MKVWILNHYATNMYFDRNGRHYWFAKHLKKYGVEPTVFCANTFHNRKDKVKIPYGKFTIKSTEKIRFVFVKTNTAIGNGIGRVLNMVNFTINAIIAAKKYGKKYGAPDLILASSVHPLTLIAGLKLAKKYSVPCICEIRDLWPEAIFAFGKLSRESLIGKLLIKGEHWIYREADALIFTKEGDTDYLKENKWLTEQGGDIDLSKCHYINNGVNLSSFDKEMKRNKLDDTDLERSKFNVVYTGMIRPVNQVDNLLDCAKLLKNNKDIQFLIYGTGSEAERLEARIKKEKIDNVKFKGFVEKKEIPYILNSSSLNILNYAQEKYNWTRGNSSNKLFEYMASAKPILSTVKMGYCPITKYECGYTIDGCTPKRLAEYIIKIKRLNKNEYEKMCTNAREAAKKFDYEILTQKLIDVIKSVT